MNEVFHALVQVGSGGLAGAILASSVNWRIYRDRSGKPDKAHEVMKQVIKKFEDSAQTMGFLSGRNANFQAATKLYQFASGELYATSFFENPVIHGTRDFVRHFTKGGSLVTRITSNDICDAVSADKTRKTMDLVLKGSQLIVVDSSKLITKIDGIFCELEDSSYVAFFSLRRVINENDNRSVVLRGAVAKWLFSYYKEVATGVACL